MGDNPATGCVTYEKLSPGPAGYVPTCIFTRVLLYTTRRGMIFRDADASHKITRRAGDRQ